MKKRMCMVFSCVQVCLCIVCLNPPRDNPFDPLNPDKAYLSGRTYTLDSTPLPAALVHLMKNDSALQTTTSDGNGQYEFLKINPGIYKFYAEALYHTPVEFYPESLSAGDKDIIDVYFNEMFFDFESDTMGTVSVPGWSVQAGSWQIVEDLSYPALHTAPNVYRGTNLSSGSQSSCLTDKEFSDFFYSVRMKSESGNPNAWQMGVYFRYGNVNNHYRLRLTDQGPTTLVISRTTGGNTFILYSPNPGPVINKDIWYTVIVECRDTVITCSITGGGLNITVPLNDSGFSSGKLGIFAINEGSIRFDDIIINTASTP